MATTVSLADCITPKTTKPASLDLGSLGLICRENGHSQNPLALESGRDCDVKTLPQFQPRMSHPTDGSTSLPAMIRAPKTVSGQDIQSDLDESSRPEVT
jgi:hypothetical protein